MGRIRLHVALDFSAYSLETFILESVEPGSTIATDSWRSYNFIEDAQWAHEKVNLSASSKDNESLYGVHLVTSLIKRIIRGTFHGRFEPKYLQNYLDEYVFRFNRRKSKNIGKKFMRLVQQVVKSAKITYSEIMWDIDPISEYHAT
jgi:hypothetical protein